MKENMMLFFTISGIWFWIFLIYRLVSLPDKIKNKDYEIISYCSDCHKDTVHLCHNEDNKEFSNYKICLSCRKIKTK